MPNTKKPLVLVVDDNPLNRELAKALLDCLGFRSVEAVDGFDALKKYQACEPVAVLMDFTMPNLGGLEALKQLRELELHLGRKRVPVVILTERRRRAAVHQLLPPGRLHPHLARAYEREQSPAAKDAIAQILTNSRMCAEGHRPICQDTGIVNVFLKIGMDVRWDGFATMGVEDMVNEGVRRAYN
jgi:CheY-like chemotaxis protein